MKMRLLQILLFLLLSWSNVFAQTDTLLKRNNWKFNAAVGLDFAQMLLVNPKLGAGENKIAFGGNTVLGALYKNGRFTWKSTFNTNFAVQKLGIANKPFQKTFDEMRLTSLLNYLLKKESKLGYAFDISFLTQITPTYEGNYLSYFNTSIQHPLSKFLSPATFVISPGISYKPNNNFTLLFSPASYKTIFVIDDSIAMLSNADKTQSLHGTPLGGTDRNEFINKWNVKPSGFTTDGILYSNNSLQFGTTLKIFYQNTFLKDSNGKGRIGLTSSLTLFSDYLNKPQFVDIEFLVNTDFYIFKGLSISFGSILFYDYDVLVQLNTDKDNNTGINGYETTGRGVSFTQTLLIKYNFLF
jgi:hypothetical protein